jgi:GNAT superfamily N-acetyltransferase
MERTELTRLEAIAFRSWPAASVIRDRGVLLRVTGGDSHRANSAALFACDEGLAAGEIVEIVERFYGARAMSPLFQIGPTAPAGIDEALAARGYGVIAPVWVQTAAVKDVGAAAAAAVAGVPRSNVETSVDAQPSVDWIDIEVSRGRYADIARTFLDALAGLGPRAAYATARLDGVGAAACLVVHDEDVVVLAAMRTLAEARRRGAARALVHAAVRWAAERGARTAYLQVERDNEAALALYASYGFSTLYGYHYRARA